MTILAMDTSGTSASAVIMDEETIFAEALVSGPKRKSYSETLMPMIDNLFNISGMNLDDIDRIACTNGPGSFTGLRIGAACAKGLAFAAGIPLVAVPTLDAMAYTCIKNHWIVPMLDARREQVYTALYYNNERKTDYLAEPVDEILKILIEYSGKNSHIIFTGNGAVVYRDTILNYDKQIGGKLLKNASFTSQHICRLSAVYVGLLAFKIPQADERDFSLMYIRKPQAERERELKLEL